MWEDGGTGWAKKSAGSKGHRGRRGKRTRGTRRGGGQGGQDRKGSKNRAVATWEVYAEQWVNTEWGRKWWWQGHTQIRPALRRTLLGPMEELAAWIEDLGIEAKEMRGKGGEDRQRQQPQTAGEQRRRMYERVLEREEEKGRRTVAEGLQYRDNPEVVRGVFGDPWTPRRMWEFRFRVFYQVLSAAGEGGPQRRSGECPRDSCRGLEPMVRGDLEHQLRDCLFARKVWEAVGRKFGWEGLARQAWGPLVSGWLAPREAHRESREGIAEKERRLGSGALGGGEVN